MSVDAVENTAIIQHIVHGVPSENIASNKEDKMPLPYCKEPNKAEAAPTISGTSSKAAAVDVAAIIPFIEKKKKTGMIIPKIPIVLNLLDTTNTNPANIAIAVEVRSNLFN